MSAIVYGKGGYRPQHPSQGKIEQRDDATSTLTRWNDAGAVVETRPYTPEEQATADALREDAIVYGAKRTIAERAEAALAGHLAFLAIQNPSNAQLLAEMRLLARSVSGLIRIELNRYDTTDGT